MSQDYDSPGPNKKDATLSKARAIFLIYVVVSLLLFAVVVVPIHLIVVIEHETIFNTILSSFIFCSIAMGMILQVKKPFSWFGFYVGSVKQDLIETLIVTAIFCGVLVLIKYALINSTHLFHHLPLFTPGHLVGQGVGKITMKVWIYALLYILFCPLQSFLVHGAFQGAILNFFKGKYVKEISIVAATALFAVIHLSIHVVFALSMIIPGMFWAMLYLRQRSLFGVSISHMIVGLWAFYILGFGQVFQLLAINAHVIAYHATDFVFA